MKIHGGIHILIAIIIYSYSAFMKSRVETNLAFFQYIAIALFIWGVFRLTIDFMTKEKKPRELVGPPKKIENDTNQVDHRTHHHVRPHPNTTHSHIQNSGHPSHPHPHSIKCPRCHRPIRNDFRICPYCGLRLN